MRTKIVLYSGSFYCCVTHANPLYKNGKKKLFIYDIHNFWVYPNSLLRIGSFILYRCTELFLRLNLSFLWTSYPNYFISKLLLYIKLLLLQHRDIKSNPEHGKTIVNNFSCGHWNTDSFVVYNYSKFRQLEAFNSIYHYDFACVSGTYYDSLMTQIVKLFSLTVLVILKEVVFGSVGTRVKSEWVKPWTQIWIRCNLGHLRMHFQKYKHF